MIYTIGYQAITPERLAEFVEALDAQLIDCRFRPVSRKPGFGGAQLAKQFGDRYRQRGDQLGGSGHTTAEGIERLGNIQGNVLLMCLEEGSDFCHRHHDICAPHFPDARHIWRDIVMRSSDLSETPEGETVPVIAFVADLFKRRRKF